MQPDESLTPRYFDDVYAANADPWRFETSEYERAKYAATVAALPKAQFGRAFEIGCSIGVLTALLAPRCRELLAVDVNDAALAAARRRPAVQANVRFEKMIVPQAFPPGEFDLIVLSEVGYYWSRADLALAAQLIVTALAPGGVLLLVHWTPVVPDYPLTGDAVHEHFLRLPALRHLSAGREPTYRLDVFERASDANA